MKRQITIKQVSECLEKYKILHIVPTECDEVMLYPSNRGAINALLNVTKEHNNQAAYEITVIEANLNNINNEIELFQDQLSKQTDIENQAVQHAGTVILSEMNGHPKREYLHNCKWRYSPGTIATNQACMSEKAKTQEMQKEQEEKENLKKQILESLNNQKEITNDYQEQEPVREMLKLFENLNNKKIKDNTYQETEITEKPLESLEDSTYQEIEIAEKPLESLEVAGFIQDY